MTKRFIKRAISLVLALTMMFGMVQMPMFTQEVQAAELVSTNVAQGKRVSVGLNQSEGNVYVNSGYPAANAVDGTANNTNNYVDFGIHASDDETSEIKGSAYLQVDLLMVYALEKLHLYRYWSDGRTYDATVVAVADTLSAFDDKTATVVYNSDTNNIHGFGNGSDEKYAETSSGKEWVLSEAVNARYVRVYMSGNVVENANTNHIVEVQAYADVDPDAVTPIYVAEKPKDGTTTDQPFVENMGGSRNFRIPCLITLSDGTVVAAGDARWDREADNGGIDIVVSRAEDKVGEDWAYTFANYMGDNGDVFDATSSTIMDPEIVAKTVDGQETIYMLVDLFPAGYALNTSNGATQVVGDLGLNADGKLLLSDDDRANYNYYLSGNTIYQSNGTPVEGYTVDGWFNLKDANGNVITNLFYKNSPFQAVPTTYLCLTKSTDGGKNWSDPQLLNVKANGEKFYGVGPGRGLVASDGTIIFTCYTSGGTEYSSFIYSTDNGANWKRTANATSDHWSSESQLVELDNGKLRLVYRNGKGYICYVDATGNGTDGYTWGTPVSTGVSNCSSCMISAIKYSKPINGKEAMLISCPTSSSGRFDGKIHVFTLDGTEANKMTLVNSVSINSGYDTNFFAYSCMTELQNGNVAILYEDGCLNFGGTGTGRGSGYASMTYATYPIQTLAGANAQVGGIWAVDTDGNMVSGTVSMTPRDSATYIIKGTPVGSVTVTSSKTEVATAVLNEAVVAAADTGLTFTVTANPDLEGYGTTTITLADDNSSSSFDVMVASESMGTVKEVKLKEKETKSFTDDSEYYGDDELTGLNTGIATVDITGKKAELQLQLGADANYTGDLTDASGSEYTFVENGDGTYTVSATTADGNTIYLDCYANDAGYPFSNSASATVTVESPSTGLFALKTTADNGNGYLYFYRNGNAYFDRYSSAEEQCQFELYKAVSGADTSTVKGYQKLETLNDIKDGESYLIVAAVTSGDTTTRYVLHPATGTTSKYVHVAKVTDTIKVTEPAVQAATEAGNFSGDVFSIRDCEYVFTKDTDGTYSMEGITSDGQKAYVNFVASGQLPNKSTASKIAITASTTTAGSFRLKDTLYSHNNTNGTTLHFYNDTTKLYFDRCGGDGGNHALDDFEIYKRSADSEGSVIAGYKKVTTVDEITSGDSYLILRAVGSGYYMMRPSLGTNPYEYVAMLTNQTVEGDEYSDIVITGVAPGETSVKIGNVTYMITVSEREVVNVNLSIGETFTAQGTIISQDSGQNIVTTTHNLVAPYTQVSELVSGQSYLIGKSGYVVTQTAQTDSRANGLQMVNSNVNYTSGDYAAYAWKVTVVSQTDTGYTVTIQDKNGNYINFANPTGNSSTNTAVTLGSTEQVLSLVKQSDNSFTIGYTGESGYSTYLNNFGGSGTHAAGWSANGGTWNFYTGTEEITVTGANPGTTRMEIGDVLYQFNVFKEVDVTLNIGEEYNIYGAITQKPATAGIVSLNEDRTGYQKLTDAGKMSAGTYLIGGTGIIAKNEAVSISGEPNGLDVVQNMTESAMNAGDYDAYLWTFKEVTDGYTIQDVKGKYINIEATSTAANGQVVLSDTPQTFTVVAGTNGGVAIYNGTYYLNDFQNDHDNIAGYNANGGGSNLYLYRNMEDVVTITGEKVGTTTTTIGNVIYNITVQGTVNYDLLNQQIEIAGVLKDDESFTAESRTNLSNVLAEAQALTQITTPFTSTAEFEAAQKAADDMEAKLTAAIRGLVKSSRSITMTVGQKASYVVNGDLTEYDEADAKIATITMNETNTSMTVEGKEVGIFKVMVGTTSFTILISPIAENFPITSATGQGTDKIVTKLTISADATYDFNYTGDGTVTWSTEELLDTAGNQIAFIDSNGVLSFTASAVTTTLTTTVTAMADNGATYTIPVIIHPGPSTDTTKILDLFIDEVTNLEVYYVWNCGSDLVHACTGEAIYMNFDLSDQYAIDFMGAPRDEYALTYMASTNSDGDYMTIHTGDGVTVDTSDKGFLSFGAGINQANMFGEEKVMAMLYEGIIRNCDGIMGFTRSSKTTDSEDEDVVSSMTFRAEQLPTVEKNPYGILPADGKRAGFRLYEDGMKAGEGEFVYFEINVKTYRPLTLTDDNKSTVTYQNMLLTDKALSYQDENGVWHGASFIYDYGKDVVIAVDDIVPDPATVVKDITEDVQDEVWNNNETYKNHKYYVAYEITADDLDTDVINDVHLTFNYKAEYSTGDYDEASAADAKISVASFSPKNLVVDFGLPVKVEYPTWGKIEIETQDVDGQALYESVMLTEGTIKNAAKYGTVAVEKRFNTAGDEHNGWVITYTPTAPLQGVDTVTLTATNTEETYSFKVYPANSAYYEESFINISKDTDGNPDNAEWTAVGTPVGGLQQTAHPGYTKSLVDPAYNYGYDSIYADAACSEIVTAATTSGKEKASFEFTGTGVDIYANCDEQTGIAMVLIKKLEKDEGGNVTSSTLKKMFTVDTMKNFGTEGDGLSVYGELYNIPIVSLPEGSLEYGNYEALVVHVPKKVSEMSIGTTYSAEVPFVFPSVVGNSYTLEAENMVLDNTGTDEAYPLIVAKKDWASGGKIVNALNTGDSLVLYYHAPVAGTYKTTVTYRSGSEANGFSWSEASGKITAGSVTMGANDSAGETHTGEVTFEVVTPGAGVLTIQAGDSNAPQLDKFEIELSASDTATEKAGLVELSTRLRLDGFRVYGTVQDTEAVPVYSMDDEALPFYLDMKDSVLAGMNVSIDTSSYAEQIAANAMSQIYASNSNTKLNGVTLVASGNTLTYTGDTLKEYLDESAKNELYIYPGQSMVFKLEASVKNPQLAIKALNGGVTYTVTKASANGTTTGDEATLKANTEMYYPIPLDVSAVAQDDGTTVKTPLETTFTLTNTSTDAVLSVTKLKISSYYETSTNVLGEITEKDLVPALMSLGFGSEEQPEVTATPEVTKEPTVTQTPAVTEAPEQSKSVTEVFTDVHDDWYTSYVQYVYDKGLMTGIKGTAEFRPNANITKAQVAQVLYNMEGAPEVADESVFGALSDVYAEEWYAVAVAWAYDKGIVTGDLNTKKFSPNADVTREQLAVMMYRYADSKGYDVTVTSDFEGLMNADQVADWSEDAVRWAVGSGLISGVEKGDVKDLAPQGNATRAQMAAILQRFCEAN